MAKCQMTLNRTLGFLFVTTLMAACAPMFQDEPEVGVPESPTEASSMDSFLQGLKYIRENPSEREDEQLQRFLWLDQWIRLLEEKDRLTPELGQEFWTDLDSFVQNPPMSNSNLRRIIERAETSLAKNIAYYRLYQNLAQEDSIEDGMEYLEFLEEDGISDLYTKAQHLLELYQVQAVAESRKIGLLLPLSGELRSFGQQILHSVQIVSELGIAEDIEFIVQDVGTDNESLLDAFQNLALREKVSAIIGPITGEESEFVFERAQILEIPVISLATRENLELYGPYSFRSTLTLKDQVSRLAEFIRTELRARKVSAMFPDNSYGWDAMEQAVELFERRGISIEEMQIYAPGTTDFNDPLERMTRLDFRELREYELCPEDPEDPKEQACVSSLRDMPPLINFEVLFVPDSAETLGLLLPMLPFLQIYGVQVVGLSSYHSELLLERAGSAAEGVVFTEGFYSETDNVQTRFFVDSYENLSQEEPGRIAAESFDALMLLVKQMSEKTGPIRRDDLAQELRSTFEFAGVTGNIYAEGQQLRKDPKLIVVRDGSFKEWR